MSTTSSKRPHADALRDAEAFRALFPPSCYKRWEFAGSLRRQRPEVGDVEHVVEPAFELRQDPLGMFDNPVPYNLLFGRLDLCVASEEFVAKHLYGVTGYRWGEKYRGVDFRGFLHEIWCADEFNWGNILLIRTGPDSYSKQFVDTLRKGQNYRQQDGYLIHVASGERVRCPDEQTYCQFARLPYVRPEDRQ